MKRLEQDINKALDNWNERSSFRIRGVKNLSRSDLDTILLYVETGGRGLMKPVGYVAEVLEKAGYQHPLF